MHIEISVATKFRPKQTLLDFWIKLTQKWYFRTKKMKINNEFYIFKLIYILNFTLNNFDFWEKFSKKSILPVEIRKKINITIEFFMLNWSKYQLQLKLTVANFLDQICPQRVAIFNLKQIK